MSDSKVPATISGFSVLPLTMPSLPSYPVAATHYVYLRQNSPKIPTKDDDRTLFLTNLPIDSTEPHFRAVFNTLVGAGRFESIVFQSEASQPEVDIATPTSAIKGPSSKKRKHKDIDAAISPASTRLPEIWDRPIHKPGSTAIVALADAKSLALVLRAVQRLHKTGDFPVWGLQPDGGVVTVPALGSARYAAHHKLQYPSRPELSARLDAYMAAYNKGEIEAERAAKLARNVPDADGFVTVTRNSGRAAPASAEAAKDARRRQQQRDEERGRNTTDFYRFQGRERRKEEALELMRRFEDDKNCVQAMQRARFVPES